MAKKSRLYYWLTRSIAALLGVLFVVALLLLLYTNDLNHLIDTRMQQLHDAQPTVLYSLTTPFRTGQKFTKKQLKSLLLSQGYRETTNIDDMLPGDYAWDRKTRPNGLILYRPEFTGAGHPISSLRAVVAFSELDGSLVLSEIRNFDDQSTLEIFENIPVQVGAYLAGRIRTQNAIALSEMPVSMRYALMAIEDPRFLEHYGISFRGILRALVQNLRAGRASQGGSTITQQLMKNLFFTRQKHLSRKAKEAIFAFITEMRYSKEQILEAYLNEVYLGQWSTHEIHGISEGARYYFNVSATDLSLSQSALLAAMVQAPNDYDPWKYPDRAIKRRNLVLKKMAENDFILKDELKDALTEPLGIVSQSRQHDDVDYFTDLVMADLPVEIINRLNTDHLTIYVTLNSQLQSIASQTLSGTIDHLTRSYRAIAQKDKKGIKLQGAIAAIDPHTCQVLAIQGGRHYKQTQFNRILQGKRQPGSLFKPFVVLSALMANPSGSITPLTLIEDAPFEWQYDKQNWQPKNYDGRFRGLVTIQQALEESLNIPIARLTQQVGVSSLVETLKRSGIKSNIPELPSLALGSAEVTPIEVAEAYTTLANLGKRCTLRSYLQVFDGNRNLIEDSSLIQQEALPVTSTFQLVNMMKGVFTNGTARSVKSYGLNLKYFGGKTGTTNDEKDSWFIGFSPELLVLVWMGYDEKEKIGLTGASAALPAWINFIKEATPYYAEVDFKEPLGLKRCEVPYYKPKDGNGSVNTSITEYFVPGTEPHEINCVDSGS